MVGSTPFQRRHWSAAIKHLMWRVLAGAVVPVLAVFAIVTWSSPTGRPAVVDLVGRGELFLIAAGLLIATLRSLVIALPGRDDLWVEALLLAAVIFLVFSVAAWAALIEVDIAGRALTVGQEHLATVWGSVDVGIGAGFGTIATMLAEREAEL